MIEVLVWLHRILRYSHITFGALGLAVFWGVILARKGTPRHMVLGKLFAWMAWIVGGTALISSTWALVNVDSFSTWIARQPLPEQAAYRELHEFLFGILLLLSLATLTGATFGVQVVRFRSQHARLRRSMSVVGEWLSGLGGMGLVAYGIWKLTWAPEPDHAILPRMAFQVPILLGAFVVYSVFRDLQYIHQAKPEPKAWLYQHVEQMAGTGIAFHTAFLVFGANRLLGWNPPGAWRLVPWIAPAVIGTFLTSRYIRRLKMGTTSAALPVEAIGPGGQFEVN